MEITHAVAALFGDENVPPGASSDALDRAYRLTTPEIWNRKKRLGLLTSEFEEVRVLRAAYIAWRKEARKAARNDTSNNQ